MFEKQKQQKRLLIGNKGVLGAKLHYKVALAVLLYMIFCCYVISSVDE